MTTLADIEREVARRTGPFALITYVSPDAPPDDLLVRTRVYAPELQTNLIIGGYEGMWLLRRGLMSDGSPTGVYRDDDRQRRIVTWEQAAGYLSLDRPYRYAPVGATADPGGPGEIVEVCYLDPGQVIRPAALAGLRRCRLTDRVRLDLATTPPDPPTPPPVYYAQPERDLTAAFPWLTERAQVLAVAQQYKPPPVGTYPYAPYPASWWDTFLQGGHVWLTLGHDPFPQSLYLTVERPGDSLVNGLDSVTGPTTDQDEVPVSVEYGAAAAHVEVWRRAKALLQNAARLGYQTTQNEAAGVFAQLHRGRRGRQRIGEVRFSRPFGVSA